jgi:hypothetical protein
MFVESAGESENGSVAKFHSWFIWSMMSPRHDPRRESETMISFKGAHVPQDVILTGVRWYVAYPLSYRHVEELMEVDLLT